MKNIFDGRLLLVAIFLVAFNVAQCGAQPNDPIIANLKQTNVSLIDSQLESMPYEAWLLKVLGPDASIKWEVNDCGEGSNGEGNWPLCVTAIGKFEEQGEVTVSIAVGHSEKGVFGKPSVMDIYIEGVGPSRSFSSLHQLPNYLRVSKKDKLSLVQFSDKPLDEKSAVTFATNIDVRTFISSQPTQTFLHWMEVVAGESAALRWKLDGCDQVSISMQLSGNRDYRACVYAQFENKEESVLVSIEVGTYRKGLTTTPSVVAVQIYNKRLTNAGITTPTLGELPGKLADIRHGESH